MMFPTSASVVIALLMGIAGGAFVLWELRRVLSYDHGNEAMQAIAKAIQEGSAAFLSREYRVIAIFVAIVARCYFGIFTMADCVLFCGGRDCIGRRGLSGYVCGGSRQRPDGGSGRSQFA